MPMSPLIAAPMTTFCAANSNGFDCCVRALNTPRSVTNENVETDDAADFDNRLRERVSEFAFHAERVSELSPPDMGPAKQRETFPLETAAHDTTR